MSTKWEIDAIISVLRAVYGAGEKSKSITVIYLDIFNEHPPNINPGVSSFPKHPEALPCYGTRASHDSRPPPSSSPSPSPRPRAKTANAPPTSEPKPEFRRPPSPSNIPLPREVKRGPYYSAEGLLQGVRKPEVADWYGGPENPQAVLRKEDESSWCHDDAIHHLSREQITELQNFANDKISNDKVVYRFGPSQTITIKIKDF
ncbi:hypothetical protein EX30DRAFT_350500 [Ascodesmis nigricans]|uniref:Uncharacterized protein n=1 Tax=Ascodesmis nigricans TaxID=341454 RepID=A0A4S2MSQ5_9PEZI|nr:hypothetical protein EX30DRAFT_350500 [Ascodesmis nigricans]